MSCIPEMQKNQNKKIPQIEIIKDRREFQNKRVPELKEEFKLEKIVVEENSFEYDGIITIEPIEFSVKCEHHIIGISGKVFFAYMPDKLVLGLSQAPRIIEYFLNITEEIIQEEVTKKIADFFEKAIKPKGLWIVIKARHDCMCARGVRQRNARATTSVIRGLFHEFDVRDETKFLWGLK